MSSKWSKGKLIAAGLLLTILAAPAISQISGPPKRGAVGRKAVQMPVPDFTLIDQDKRPIRFGSLRGKAVLVTFIYATCPDVCPLLTAKFAGIQRGLKSRGLNHHFLLSVTTDPEADTPEVLRSYGQRFGADLRSWAFLTGDKNELSEAWRFFGVRVKKHDKGLTDHTGLTTLIDRQGIRRIDYYGNSWTENEVLKDIADLAARK
ncbi:MAG: SCO family protein [Candidatus Omnitrophica bacterium]|nr:SCO family protein [Candidatus Omnitrophota bacterium]